jgi:hypothetical protein
MSGLAEHFVPLRAPHEVQLFGGKEIRQGYEAMPQALSVLLLHLNAKLVYSSYLE